MTKRAGRRPPGVSLASPVAQPPSSRQAARISGPPARWIAPSTPPPPSSVVFAALTIASVVCSTMLPRTSSRIDVPIARCMCSYSCASHFESLEGRRSQPGGGDAMSNLAVEEAQAVVFVSNRAGAALRRRERCLKLAGIPHGVEAERRPSGTYYKLCVRENDAVAAHLALQMGGCGRTVKLQDPRPSF